MVVGECVVDRHVFEEGLDVGGEETGDLMVGKVRVDKEGTDVCFDDVGKGLYDGGWSALEVSVCRRGRI